MDYAALGTNVAARRRRLSPATRLIASVKANAYGHGIIEMARHLAELAIDRLATGSFGDALAVREAGIDADIIMRGAALPDGIAQLLAHGFKPTLHRMELTRTPALTTRLGADGVGCISLNDIAQCQGVSASDEADGAQRPRAPDRPRKDRSKLAALRLGATSAAGPLANLQPHRRARRVPGDAGKGLVEKVM